ncbi:hypothetical protein DFJ73DRAFT_151103 [Zopfochytrium polystomum]|nr:hypothetical protein DFJ73DRAFT_151103 [Zopfochytrium polystomum]
MECLPGRYCRVSEDIERGAFQWWTAFNSCGQVDLSSGNFVAGWMMKSIPLFSSSRMCDVTLTGNVISADMRVPFRSTDWPAVARDELGPVTCCYNETWTDRSLHATDALKPGDLVLRELPALIALLPTMSAQRCDECGTLLPLNPVCCDHCVTPFFCSIKCKLKSVHSKVCNQTHTLDGLDSEWLLSIKLLSASNTWRRRPSRVLDVSQSTLTLSVEDALARLQGHESKMPRSKRASLAKAASSLVSLHSLPFAHPVLVGALCKEESSLLGEQQGEIGKGLFLKAAHLNHSCEPNAVAMFDPTNCQIVVKVTRPLLAMDEILISYGPTASRMKCVERRRLLLEKWSFNCECAACHAPDLACLYTNAFPCTSANCPWPVQIEDSACSVCLSPAVIDVQGFNASCSLFESALQAVGERKLSLLAKVEVLRTRLCHPTSFQLACLYDAMGKELAEQGVFDLASKYVLRAVKIIEKIYGVAGVEMAKERLKLAELFYLAGKVARARVWASRALEMRWLLSDSEIAATLPMLTASADQ